MKGSLWEAFASLGLRNIIIAVIAIAATTAALAAGFYALYASVKESISLRGEISAREFSKSFDEYLLTGLNTIKMTGYTVDTMLRNKLTHVEIEKFLKMESENIKNTLDSDSTGLYGLINDVYVDGSDWVPGPDFNPRERPWYLETMANKTDITFVKPYVDLQTGTAMMTITGLLEDGKSIVAIDVSLREVQEITEHIGDAAEGGIGMVLDNEGGVVAHTDRSQVKHDYLKENGTLGSLIARRIFVDKTSRFEVEYGNTSYMVYAEPLAGGWVSVSAMNTAELFKLPRFIIQFSVLVTLLSLAVIITILYKIALRNHFTLKLNMQLSSVGRIYVCMYDVDIDSNTCSKISYHDFISGRSGSAGKTAGNRKGCDLAGKTAPEESGNPAPENVVCDKCFGLDDGAVALIPGDAQASFTRIAARISDESSRERMLQFVDLSTLDERMRGVNTVTEEFLNCCNKWCRTRFIAEKRDDAGQLVRVIWLVELIDRERRQREKLKHLAEIDQMTGICNRGTGEHRISELLSEKQSGMFLLLDIDKFKQYNDTYGHKVGDQVIISVAKALTASFRSYDVVMRLGGDEFAVYALGLTTRDKAQAVIERLLRNIQAIRIPEIGDRSVYVSAGAAFYRGDGDIAFQEIYEQADGCAYMSKKDAGNAVTYFNS